MGTASSGHRIFLLFHSSLIAAKIEVVPLIQHPRTEHNSFYKGSYRALQDIYIQL